MWISFADGCTARIMRATPSELAWLYEYLSVPERRRGMKPVRRTLVNQFAQTFPAGYVQMVREAARDSGVLVQVVDAREPPCDPDPAADLAWLRDYQRDAVEALVQERRGILHLPTGAGKTEIAVGITRRLPCLWLFLVASAGLAEQAAARYEKRTPGMRAGRLFEGQWSIPEDAQFLAATPQTLRSAKARGQHILRQAKGLFFDECHTLPAETFLDTVRQATSAYYWVGLSGTPLDRDDAKSFHAIGAIGSVIYRVPTQLLVDQEVIAKAIVHMPLVHQPGLDTGEDDISLARTVDEILADAKTKRTFHRIYTRGVTRSPLRNAFVVEAARRAPKPAFLFVKEVAHGKILAKALGKAGLSCAFSWGDDLVDRRERYCRDLAAGRLEVLIVSAAYQQGYDVPELQSVIIGSSGKSVIATLQRIGRGMRTRDAAGRLVKLEFHVYDFSDSGQRWLREHSARRAASYASEGHTVLAEQWVVSSPV